jgi:uncharacterized membrane protein YtjA (UPF0391 family)
MRSRLPKNHKVRGSYSLFEIKRSGIGVGPSPVCFVNTFDGSPLFTKNLFCMLRWTVIFLIIALVAAVFGFFGIAAGAASIAKILFFIFIVLFLISLIAGRRSGINP